MSRLIMILAVLALGLAGVSAAPPKFEKDVFPTAKGDLEITFLGHGSLMMTFGGKTIHVDPYGDVADYGTLPKADLVLVTHEHFDHLDPKALKAILKPDTTIVASKSCAVKLPGAVIMANGEKRAVLGLVIEALPAYNIAHKTAGREPLPSEGRRQRLRRRLRRQARLHRRRYGSHAGDDLAEGDRRRLPAHGSPLYDVRRSGRRGGQSLPAEGPLSLSLRGHRHGPAGQAPARGKRDRDPDPKAQLTAPIRRPDSL